MAFRFRKLLFGASLVVCAFSALPAWAACTALTNGVVPLFRYDVASAATVFTQATSTATAVVEGALAYDTVADLLKVCDGTSWASLGGGGSSQWTTAGSDIYYNTGNVGIGTSAPAGKLDVYGTDTDAVSFVSTNNVAGSGLKLAFFAANRSTADEEMAAIKPVLSTNNGGAGNVQLGHLAFETGGTEKMRITSSGNVGIGTTTPDTPLHIRATSAGANVLTLGDGRADDYGWLNFKGVPQPVSGYTVGGLQSYSSLVSANTRVGLLQFAKEGSGTDNKTYFEVSTHNGTAFAERMRIDSAGNVGVGTASPGALLTLGNSAGTMGVLRLQPTGAGAYWDVFDDAGDFKINQVAVGTRFVIDDTSGNVGIGTTAPSEKLHLSAGNILLDNGYQFRMKRNTGGSTVNVLGFDSGTDNLILRTGGAISTTRFGIINTGGTELFTITNDGNVGIGTTTPGAKLDVQGNVRVIAAGGLSGSMHRGFVLESGSSPSGTTCDTTCGTKYCLGAYVDDASATKATCAATAPNRQCICVGR